MPWLSIAAWVGMSFLSYFLAPKPKDAIAASFDSNDFPVAEDGSEIPVVFGTRDIAGANVVWYGDVRTSPIKSGGGKK